MTVKATLGSRFALVQGVLPINPSQVPHEIIAGLTLAALAIPEVMGLYEDLRDAGNYRAVHHSYSDDSVCHLWFLATFGCRCRFSNSSHSRRWISRIGHHRFEPVR